MIDTLNEYLDFLKKIEEDKVSKPELANYIEEELYPALIFEEKHLNELYTIHEILDYFEKEISTYSEQEVRKTIKEYEIKLGRKLKGKDKIKIEQSAKEVLHLIIEEYKNINLFEKQDEIIKDWLNDALKELQRAKILYKCLEKDPDGYIQHLGMAVEKMMKAYGMILGIIEEKKLIEKIGHTSSKIYTLLIDRIRKSPNKEKILQLINFNSQKFEYVVKILEKPSERLGTEDIVLLDMFIPSAIEFYEFLKSFLSPSGIDESKKIFIGNIIFFAYTLPFISVLFSYLYNLRYPDTRKEKHINYLEMNITKNFEKIASILETFIKNSINMLNAVTLKYFPLHNSIEKHLKPIKDIKSDDRKLKTIKKAINDIKRDKEVRILLDRVKAHPKFKNWLKSP
ncbi:MAG: hypothetical protein QW540_07635 [Archaeoglobaceae archaeon]